MHVFGTNREILDTEYLSCSSILMSILLKLLVLLFLSLQLPYLKKLSFLQLGILLDRRILPFVLPVFFFIILYSKLPHKVLDIQCSFIDFHYFLYTPFIPKYMKCLKCHNCQRKGESMVIFLKITLTFY